MGKTITVRLMHNSSIPQARWAKPIGWEPQNEIGGSEYVDGSWWDEYEETAGIVCFAEGDEGDEIEVSVDECRIASTGNCRVIEKVKVAKPS